MRNLGPWDNWMEPSAYEMEEINPRPNEVENWEMKIWPAVGPWKGDHISDNLPASTCCALADLNFGLQQDEGGCSGPKHEGR